MSEKRDIWYLRAMAMAAMIEAIGYDPGHILEADASMCLSLFCAAKGIPVSEFAAELIERLELIKRLEESK